jgi:hypothetical protein
VAGVNVINRVTSPPPQNKKAGLHNVMTAFYSISEQRMTTTGTCITAAFSCIICFLSSMQGMEIMTYEILEVLKC